MGNRGSAADDDIIIFVTPTPEKSNLKIAHNMSRRTDCFEYKILWLFFFFLLPETYAHAKKKLKNEWYTCAKLTRDTI